MTGQGADTSCVSVFLALDLFILRYFPTRPLKETLGDSCLGSEDVSGWFLKLASSGTEKVAC